MSKEKISASFEAVVEKVEEVWKGAELVENWTPGSHDEIEGQVFADGRPCHIWVVPGTTGKKRIIAAYDPNHSEALLADSGCLDAFLPSQPSGFKYSKPRKPTQ